MTDPTLDDDDPNDTAGDTPWSGTPLRLPTVAEQNTAIAHLLWVMPTPRDPATGEPFVGGLAELVVEDPEGDADIDDDEDDDELQDTGP